MEMGTMVSPLVLSTKNIIIGLVAVSFFLFSSCSPSIVLSPKGVAALSSPSMLAEIFINILPNTGWFLGMSGKSFTITGLRKRARAFTSPPLSPIFMMPSHNDSTPVRPRLNSKAVLAVSKVESMMAGKTSMSPMNTSLIRAITKAIAKKAIQM